MKRDGRLLELSREHHTALKLARRLQRASSPSARDLAAEALRGLRLDLEFHFDEEEVGLLPVLWHCGRADLAERLCSEHVELRAMIVEALDGHGMERLGALLEAHVRFEEREMFPWLESYWADNESVPGRDPGFSPDAPVWMYGRAAMHSVNLGGN